MSEFQEKSVAILGLGLMGTSLALALKGLGVRVVGYNHSPANARTALERGAVDAVAASPAEAVAGASMVVLAAPVLANLEFADAIAGSLEEGAVVTDMGSTKGVFCRRAAERHPGMWLVGSHPVAGSEKQGGGAARADLFMGRRTVVTPVEGVPEEAVRRVEALWRAAGSATVRMAPEDHDRLLARTSHLPHLVSAALAGTIGRNRAGEVGMFCGPGFCDSTRLAAGSIQMWRDILATNREAIETELRAFKDELDALYRDIQSGDSVSWTRFLERARSARAALLEGQSAPGGGTRKPAAGPT
ncbi:MAG: prephenate dehydrogenase/arogenate dehydrogenase family protein [Kiritimatiellae bacterium]|nr:prephenate dehydrogenase/arogenate dehydrogenase family protein [Kiritimatiellia bacterium]